MNLDSIIRSIDNDLSLQHQSSWNSLIKTERVLTERLHKDFSYILLSERYIFKNFYN